MTAYRFARILITKWRDPVGGTDGIAGAVRAQEIKFLDAVGGVWPPSMTGAATPVPYAITASSFYSAGSSFPSYLAFDGVVTGDASRWHSILDPGVAQWIQVDFGEPVDVSRVRYMPDVSGGYPIDFQILGSATGAFTGEEVLIRGFTGLTTGWTPQVYRDIYMVDGVVSATAALPPMAASAYAGANAGSTLPAMAGAAFSAAVTALVLPVLKSTARGGSNASATLPMLFADAVGGPGVTPGLTGVLPMLVAAAQGGANASSDLPALLGYSTATFSGWAQTVLALPPLRASATGTTGGVTAVAGTLPMFVATSQGGGNAASTLPALKATSGATVGGIASVRVGLPRLVAGLVATRQNSGSMAAILPALAVVNSGVMRATLPALVGFASGYVVMAYTYEAYAVNLNHKPTPGVASIDEVTRFTNYPFDKIVRYRNSYFGVAADGLYLLEGTTDDGTPIEWNVQTAVSDFGSPQKKTLVSTYLAGRFGSAATVDLHVGEKGAETYSYASPRGPDIQNFRQKFGRGVKARYFALGLSGTEELQLDALDFETLVLSRRI